MRTGYDIVLALHVAAGLIGLAAFWTPAVARKGGTLHVRAGRLFYYATLVIAITCLSMAVLLLADPLGVKPLRDGVSSAAAAEAAWRIRLTAPFLVYLVLITFTPVYHGVRVLETRRAPALLRTPFHTAIHAAAVGAALGMIVLGVATGTPVFAAMSPIGFLLGFGNLAFARKPYRTPMAWWYEHMGAMMAGGIAFHTAFLVLGAGRLLGIELTGTAAIVPWVLPTVVGLPATALWVRHYRRKFREDRPAAGAVTAGV